MSKKSRTERLNLSMDENLKRRFNTVCTWKGVNMSDVAHELIERWVEENAPPGLFDGSDNNVDQKKDK
jgi:antitoxin component of RelBE/YafQ-DinJ toxin-antitoxin module